MPPPTIEDFMTRKTTKNAKPAGKRTKRLSLSKQTLKDLGTSGQGPKGGTLMATIKACATTQACQRGGATGGIMTTVCRIGSF
jgi:hypothetical protein